MAGDKRATRLGVLALVAAMLFGALGVRLWFLQAVEASSLQAAVDQSSLRTVLIPPVRGQIIDADGRLLAGNEATNTVAVDWAQIRKASDRATLFQRLSGWLGVPVADMEARYQADTYSRFRPLPLAEDVPENVVIAIQERYEDFPGVSAQLAYRRVYPYSPLASPVIGYMGAITAETQAYYRSLGYDTSNRGERVGRAGIEQQYETTLHGTWGRRVVEIDAAGRVVRVVSETPPVNGQDIQLSIDLDLQQYAEQMLQLQLRLKRAFLAPNPIVEKPNGSHQRMDLGSGPAVYYPAPAGSVIIMNNATGQVMAMASYPSFDNRWFSQPLSDEKYKELFDRRRPDGSQDPDKAVLINRAIQGQYNLGSAFKPFVAYSAMMAGLLGPDDYVTDNGTYKAESIPDDVCATGVKCVWRNSTCSFNHRPCVYGTINVQSALAVSSDVFFYRLGERFFLKDRNLLQNYVRQFGFGADTMIDLPSEFDGRIPDDALKAELVAKHVLAPGETPKLLLGDEINMAIGQGLLAASPLQLAVGYSAIANGGYVMAPRVMSAILAPNTPAGATPGTVDMSQAVVVQAYTPAGRAIDMPGDVRNAILSGIRQNVTGPGVNGRTTTAEELFAVGYPADAIDVAGKTGTAQGFGSYPWNDSSVFAGVAYGDDAVTHPYTVVGYLEKAGYGSRGAAPVVKCMFLALSGMIQLDPVVLSEPLDTHSDQVAHPLRQVGTDCLRSSDPNTVYPGTGLAARVVD